MVYEQMIDGSPGETSGWRDDEGNESEPLEPEIIPPERWLQPAAVERMMRELEENTRQGMSRGSEADYTEVTILGQTVFIANKVQRG